MSEINEIKSDLSDYKKSLSIFQSEKYEDTRYNAISSEMDILEDSNNITRDLIEELVNLNNDYNKTLRESLKRTDDYINFGNLMSALDMEYDNSDLTLFPRENKEIAKDDLVDTATRFCYARELLNNIVKDVLDNVDKSYEIYSKIASTNVSEKLKIDNPIGNDLSLDMKLPNVMAIADIIADNKDVIEKMNCLTDNGKLNDVLLTYAKESKLLTGKEENLDIKMLASKVLSTSLQSDEKDMKLFTSEYVREFNQKADMNGLSDKWDKGKFDYVENKIKDMEKKLEPKAKGYEIPSFMQK